MPHLPRAAALNRDMAGHADRALACAYLDADADAGRDPRSVPVPFGAAAGHLLATVRFAPPSAASAASPGSRPAGTARPEFAAGALEVVAPFAQLGPRPLREAWWTGERPRLGEAGPLRFAATEKVLFGALDAGVGRPGELESATHELYVSLLDACARLGFPHIVRIWNAVPRINGEERDPSAGVDLERYMLFCRGRSVAFERRFGRGFAARLPAASAVGCDGSRLAIHFLAARGEARHVENPRQVAAYCYPPRYGPRSPSFARATYAPVELGSTLFVSGTASVVGHESVHPGDAVAQTDESMRNIDALLGHAGAAGRAPRLLRVYVRDPRDAEAVRARLDELAPGVPGVYLHADICRTELLVEIEAVV